MANEFRVKNGIITPKIISEESDGRVVLTQTATTDDEPIVLAFETAETDIQANDVLGRITFAAPDEAGSNSGAEDGRQIAAAIEAKSEGDFSDTSNATSLIFKTGASEAATSKWKITSAGVFTPTGTNNLDIGVAGAGTVNDIHFSSGGRLTFGGSDTLTHSTTGGGLLTLAGATFVAPTLRYSTSFLSAKEVSVSGEGVLFGQNAHASIARRNNSVLLTHSDVDLASQSSTTIASTLSLSQANSKLSVIVTDGTSVGDEELFPLAYFNVTDNSYTIYHSLEITGQVKVNYDSDHATSGLRDDAYVDYNETMRATFSPLKGAVEFQSINSTWSHNIQAQGPPGEFCAQLLTDDSSVQWLVVSYVNYKSYTSEFTTTITAHINALQNPVINQG